MTTTANTPAARFARYLDRATAAYEAGFTTKAAQQGALADLNRAYEVMRDEAFDLVRAAAFAATSGTEEADYQARNDIFRAHDLPFDLHQVRAAHLAIFTKLLGDRSAMVADLIALRAAIKGAQVVRVERPQAAMAARVAQVQRTLIAEIERRKGQYVRALDMARHFGGMPVTVNAHLVTNHFGTTFVRHFFYVAGELTALNVILAAMDTHAREQEVA